MGAISQTHVLIVLSAVAIVYALWMMYFTMRESRRMNKPGHKDNGDTLSGEKERRGTLSARAVLSSLRGAPGQKLPYLLKMNEIQKKRISLPLQMYPNTPGR